MQVNIISLYRSLEADEKELIKIQLQRKPILLKFFELLNNMKKLSPIRVVHELFDLDVSSSDQKKYLSKFYKLKKELKTILIETKSSSRSALSDEERDSNYSMQLMLQNEEKIAIALIEKLKTQFYKDEFYELLPKVIRLELFYIKRVAPFDKESIQQKQKELSEAYKVKSKFEQLIVLAESFMLGDYEALEKCIKSMQRIVNEYPKSIRLRKIYHFSIINWKLSYANIIVSQKHVIARHINQLKDLIRRNGNVQFTFIQKHSDIIFSFKLEMLEFSFNLMLSNFAECEKSIVERNLIRRNNKQVYLPVSYSELSNDYTFYLVNKKFSEALETTQEIAYFFEEEGLPDMKIYPLLQKSAVLFFDTTNKHQEDLTLLLKQLKSNRVDKHAQIFNKIDESIFYLTFLIKDYLKAKLLLKDASLINNFKNYSIDASDINQVLDVLEVQKGKVNIAFSKHSFFSNSNVNNVFGEMIMERFLTELK
jgi:hypothetical protein